MPLSPASNTHHTSSASTSSHRLLDPVVSASSSPVTGSPPPPRIRPSPPLPRPSPPLPRLICGHLDRKKPPRKWCPNHNNVLLLLAGAGETPSCQSTSSMGLEERIGDSIRINLTSLPRFAATAGAHHGLAHLLVEAKVTGELDLASGANITALRRCGTFGKLCSVPIPGEGNARLIY